MDNVFFQSYFQSDAFGKSIFWILFCFSIVCWTIFIYKFVVFKKIYKFEKDFNQLLTQHKKEVLSFEKTSTLFNPFFAVYLKIKQKTLDHLNKNKILNQTSNTSLSFEDLESITITADTSIQEQIQKLEKHSFLLSTIATLSPFMGLLGTVWGILISFSELQHATSLRETVLGGLSTALSTTVVGLIIAIPAIIFHNTLKNSIADLQMKLQSTALNIRDLIELQYKHS